MATRKVMPIIYEVDVVDKGTKAVLKNDRAVRKELGETTGALKAFDRQQASTAATSTRFAGSQAKVAREAAQTSSALQRTDRAHRDVARGARISADAEEKVLRRLRETKREAREAAAAQDRLNDRRRAGARIRATASAPVGAARVGIGGGAGAIAGVLGVASAGEAARKMAEEYTEAAKVGGQTNAVIRSTGGAANVSTAEVERLAQALSNKVAVDDETIQSGANVLLTFTNIRNEAGRGKDIFDRTTAAAVDMAAAMKTEPTAAAKALGKALNDPEKGIARLSRAGVTFTAQQEKQIKAMVKSGDVAGAQGVILDEVSRKFGGSARAQATSADRLDVAMDNLAETAGRALAPSVERAADDLATFVVGMQEGTGAGGRFADRAREVARDLAPLVEGLKDAGSFLVRHPKLVIAAGGAWISFRAARGVVGTFKSVRTGAGAMHDGMKWMARTKLGESLVSRITGPMGGLGGRMTRVAQSTRAPFSASMGRTGTVAGRAAAANTAEGLADRLPASMNARSGRFSRAARGAGRLAGRGLVLGIIAGIALEGPRIAAEVDKWIESPDVDGFLDKIPGRSKLKDFLERGSIPGTKPGGRAGGILAAGGFRRFRAGGMVDALVSPGEEIEYDGRAYRVPGARVAADSVHVQLPIGAAVLTDHGQQLRAQGASLHEAIREQMPHFAKGGIVRSALAGRRAGWSGRRLVEGVAIAGPESAHRDSARLVTSAEDSRGRWQINTKAHPWARSLNLTDPDVNARAAERIRKERGSWTPWTAWTAGSYRAWMDRARAAVTGTRGSSSARTGDVAGSGAGGTRTVPLGPLGRSRTRGGLLDDAFGQGVELGRAGYTRAALKVTGNPIVAASRAALTRDMFQRTVDVPEPAARAAGRSSRLGRNITPGVRARPGGGWAGSEGIVRALIRGMTPTSLKRAANHPLSRSNPNSDHNAANRNAYAADLPPGDGIFNMVARRAGIAARKGSWNVFSGRPVQGYRTQLLWHAPDGSHRDHVHLGVRRMRRGGIAGAPGPGQPGYVGRALTVAATRATNNTGGSLEALDIALGNAVSLQIGRLRRQIDAAVKKGGNRRAVLRLRQMLDVVDGELGRRVGMAERMVEESTARRGRWIARRDREARVLGIDGDSVAGIDRQADVQAFTARSIQAEVVTLQGALKNAQRAGNRTRAQELRDKLMEMGEAIAEAAVRQIELARERIRAVAREAADQASFVSDLTAGGRSQLEASQRLAAVGVDTSTAAGQRFNAQQMRERAAALTGGIGALENQRAAVGAQAGVAWNTGDAAGLRQSILEYQRLGVDITSAMADAAELLQQAAQAEREAAMQIAESMVTGAQAATGFADQAVERLELEQKLAGTYDSGGGALARAQAISGTIDEIDQEIIALQAQRDEANRQGNTDLARTILSTLGDRQLEILRRQLAAQEATKEAVDQSNRLLENNGSLALEFRGASTTDELTGFGAGA